MDCSHKTLIINRNALRDYDKKVHTNIYISYLKFRCRDCNAEINWLPSIPILRRNNESTTNQK